MVFWVVLLQNKISTFLKNSYSVLMIICFYMNETVLHQSAKASSSILLRLFRVASSGNDQRS